MSSFRPAARARAWKASTKVRLGIEIPGGGSVHRREVYEAIVGLKDHQDTEPLSSLLPDGDH